MMTVQNPPVASGRRFASILPFALAQVLALAAGEVAYAQDAPLGAWRQTLAQVDSGAKGLRADDAAGRAKVAGQAAELRSGISTWLASYAPAQNETWLLPAPESITRIEDLTAEIGRLRSAISMIAASIQRPGESQPFYLGVVDVAVTTEPVSATMEMTPAGATVITADDIQTYDRQSLPEALALVPGVALVRAGSRNESQINVRGYDVRQVPVFIDGIPAYTPYDGYADLERFMTFDVSELRVSKGFSSVLYGPNALGGAVNVVSRRPLGRLEATGGATFASGDSRDGYVNLGSRFKSGYVQGGGSYLVADTFPLSDKFVATRYQAAGERDNAYRRDGKFNVKLGVIPRSTDEYAISYVAQRGKKGNPVYAGSDPNARARFWKWPFWNKDSVYFVSNTALGSASYLRGRAFYDKYDNRLDSYDDNTYTTQIKGSSFQSLYHDKTYGMSAEWGRTFGTLQTLRAAFHAKNDRHAENNVGAPVTKIEGWLLSLGIEDTIALSAKLSLVAGISGDRQTTSRAQNNQSNVIVDLPVGSTQGVNPQVGVFYSVADAGKLRVTASHKTRLPTMKDRYSFKFGAAIPNPGLNPERSNTFETGFQGTAGTRTTYDAAVFYSRLTDAIQTITVAPSLIQQQNVGRASAAGFEAATRIRPVSQVDVNFNYSFLRRKNLSNPAVLPIDAPRHKGLFSVTVAPISQVRVMGIVEFESGRKLNNQSGGYVDAGDITTLSAKAIWTIYRQIDAEIAGMNLTDKNYWLSEGYPEAGRTVRVNLRFRF
jgi:iron complex outermembrane recepter protein